MIVSTPRSPKNMADFGTHARHLFSFHDLEAVGLKLRHDHFGQVSGFFRLYPMIVRAGIIFFGILDKRGMDRGIDHVSRLGHRTPPYNQLEVACSYYISACNIPSLMRQVSASVEASSVAAESLRIVSGRSIRGASARWIDARPLASPTWFVFRRVCPGNCPIPRGV